MLDENLGLAFENVSYTYPETGIEAIKGLSFKLSPGKPLRMLEGLVLESPL